MTRREETRAVKLALAAAGISATVTHGHGSTYGWLRVYPTRLVNLHGESWRQFYNRVEHIALDASGRFALENPKVSVA